MKELELKSKAFCTVNHVHFICPRCKQENIADVNGKYRYEEVMCIQCSGLIIVEVQR